VSDPGRDDIPKVWGQDFDRATGELVALPKQSTSTITDLNSNGGVKESLCVRINREPERRPRLVRVSTRQSQPPQMKGRPKDAGGQTIPSPNDLLELHVN
jgi:hypothetical protein